MTASKTGTRVAARLAGASLALAAASAGAQLTDITQTSPHVTGGAIGKSLNDEVGAGRGDIHTPGSSMYLIARDPARAVRRGRQLFQRKFTMDQGNGPRVNIDSDGDIMSDPALGAGMSDSCAACHGRPRGSAGFGGDVVTRPDSRNAPHLFGIGIREMIGDEMTRDLRAIRDLAAGDAAAGGADVTLPLTTKNVSFGTITAHADGTFDVSHVVGVNADLRVRPFFADGREYSLRAFAVGAFNDEMGLQAADPVLCEASDPLAPVATISPAGMVFDPIEDRIKRPPTCDATADPDLDGITNEIDPALVDYMEFYLLNYFRPGTGKSTARSIQGGKLMKDVGCTSCHVAAFRVDDDRRVADFDTHYDPVRGIFNRLFAVAKTLFHVVPDGDAYPEIVPDGAPFVVRNLFTDFKRHDVGPLFYERNYDGTTLTQFMTSPLWGIGTKSPFGHDGRSVTIEDVILRHGGEAQAARDRFAALGDDDQHKLLEFLGTQVLFPPDDTASTLNPGNPAGSNMQDPAQHGSIALSALFQIPSEGGE